MLNQLRWSIFFENCFQKDLVFFLEHDLSSMMVSSVQNILAEHLLFTKLGALYLEDIVGSLLAQKKT